MAKYHGKSGIIKAVTKAGTLAVIGEVKSFDINVNSTQVSTNKIGTEWEESIAGLKNWEGSAECYFDPDDVPQDDILTNLIAGTEIDIEMLPIGEDTADPSFTGTAWVTSVAMRVDNESVVSFDISFTGNGALTFGTVSA